MPANVHDRENALAVLTALRSAGHIAYFAGGCVRDLLLGLSPKDFDVATDATPDRVRNIFPDTQAVGAAFGVILVRHKRSVIEVATFRSDGKYTDGRRPDAVRFSSPEEDAARRDFTINGLFLDPVDDRVIDFVGGRADLESHLIRAIGVPAERFAEDHLRMLRAVRFAARLGFDLDPVTRAAIVDHAGHLPRISPERIAEELRKILVGKSAAVGWELLWDLSFPPIVLRFLPQSGSGKFDQARSLMVASVPPESVGYGLAVGSVDYLWHRSGLNSDIRAWLSRTSVLKIVQGLRQGLKISNEESDEIEGILTGLGVVLAHPPAGVARLKRFLATPTSRHVRALMEAMSKCELHKDRIESIRPELDSLGKTVVDPTPLINGDDLTAAGAQPGPKFKLALDAVYDAQLEDRIENRIDAMALAMSFLKS